MRWALLLGAAALLAGCTTAADIASLATGGAAGAATASPAVGYAVVFGTRVALDQVVLRYARVRQHAEQDAIAQTAALLPPGGEAPWRIRHTIPIGNERGEVRVVRDIPNALAACREIAFSVADPPDPSPWYETTICRDSDAWHWALAEPATARWGSFGH